MCARLDPPTRAHTHTQDVYMPASSQKTKGSDLKLRILLLAPSVPVVDEATPQAPEVLLGVLQGRRPRRAAPGRPPGAPRGHRNLKRTNEFTHTHSVRRMTNSEVLIGRRKAKPPMEGAGLKPKYWRVSPRTDES